MDKEKVGKFYDVVWTEYIPEYTASEKHWNIFFPLKRCKENLCWMRDAERAFSA